MLCKPLSLLYLPALTYQFYNFLCKDSGFPFTLVKNNLFSMDTKSCLSFLHSQQVRDLLLSACSHLAICVLKKTRIHYTFGDVCKYKKIKKYIQHSLSNQELMYFSKTGYRMIIRFEYFYHDLVITYGGIKWSVTYWVQYM